MRKWKGKKNCRKIRIDFLHLFKKWFDNPAEYQNLSANLNLCRTSKLPGRRKTEARAASSHASRFNINMNIFCNKYVCILFVLGSG